MKTTVVGSGVIYGEWDDVKDNQLLVVYQLNGKYCDVYLFSGCDYGGGISEAYRDISSARIDEILNRSDYSDSELKTMVSVYLKNECKLNKMY